MWLLLLGGVRDAWESSLDDGTDAAKLAHDTWIPRVLWKAGFVAAAIACLLKGAQLMLRA